MLMAARSYLRCVQKAMRSRKSLTSSPRARPRSPSTRRRSMSYVIDNPPETNLYRVTVTVGYQSLTRAYVAQNNTVQPAGAWTRKE